MPTFTLISNTTVGAGGASSVSLSNIPQVFDDLRLICLIRNTASNVQFNIHLNGDTASGSYAYTQMQQNTAGTTVATSNSGTFDTFVGLANWPGLQANSFAFNDFYFPQYRETVRKNAGGFIAQTDSTSTSVWQRVTNNTWINSATSLSAITSMTLSCAGGGNLAQHSSITLYGIKRT